MIINVLANDVRAPMAVSSDDGRCADDGADQGCCGLQQRRHLHLHAEGGRGRRRQLHLHDHGRRRRHLDGDGDADDCGGLDAQVGTPTNLTVDEDGFAFAAKDTITARNDETASTESLTQSGTVVVNFGNDVPANLLASIVLQDTALRWMVSCSG